MNNCFKAFGVVLILFSSGNISNAQINGNLQLNANFFQRDSAIGASSNPLYDNLLSGGEGWLNLGYTHDNFTAGLRFDMFSNSNLHDPAKAYTDQGIGFWFLKMKTDKLTLTGGYFYDQFGSGIIYRSYEDRGLGIDYATLGIRLQYELNDNWSIRGFMGREKHLFTQWKPNLKGACIDGNISIGKNIQLLPGAGILNRTIDQASMDQIVGIINAMPDCNDRFAPAYNVYAATGYNTLSIKNISLYTEYAWKSEEAINNATGNMINRSGSVFYSSLSYSKKGFGITLQGKRTENFVLRTSPNETLLNGVLDYIPSLTQQNAMRLLARYNPATQYLGEMAMEGDIVWTPWKGVTYSFNYSNVSDLNNTHLWTEFYGSMELKRIKNLKGTIGAQKIFYNENVYQFKTGLPDVSALTPFVEFTYKLNKKQSIHFDFEYQNVHSDSIASETADKGSWMFALIEYSIAPHWSFAVSDMYNIKPNPAITTDKNHYYNIFASYTRGANRFTLAYVKQVDGVNCTGGVCRYEPAFSGIKFTLNSSF